MENADRERIVRLELKRFAEEGIEYAKSREYGLYRNTLLSQAQLLLNNQRIPSAATEAIGFLTALNYLDANDPHGPRPAHLQDKFPEWGYPDHFLGCPFSVCVGMMFDLAEQLQVKEKTLELAFINTAKKLQRLFNAPRSPESAWNAVLKYWHQDPHDPKFTKQQCGDRTTLLHRQSACNDDPKVIRSLIADGADVNAIDSFGNTPLLDAARTNRNPRVITALVSNGADVDARYKPYGSNCLHEAIRYRNLAVIKVLLKNGADTLAKSNKGETPFELAVRVGLDEDLEPEIKSLRLATNKQKREQQL